MRPVRLPRSQALQIARYERDSLLLRASTSLRCPGLWRAAGIQAGKVVSHLELGQDGAAGRAAALVGPAWKRAADCEGWPTPAPVGQDAQPGEINYPVVDRFTAAHFGVGMLLAHLGLGRWQTAFISIAWEVLERPLKRRVPEIFPHASQDTLANAIGDAIAMELGWAAYQGWKK